MNMIKTKTWMSTMLLIGNLFGQIPSSPIINTSSKGVTDGPAELPRVYFTATNVSQTPTPGARTNVPALGLQNALNNAHCGDVLLLPAGSSFPGAYNFPNKGCDDAHWIQVRTATGDSLLPPEGTRISPCYFGVSALPGRPAFNCPTGGVQNLGAKLYATGGQGPIIFTNGSRNYRIGPGIEITRAAGGLKYQLVQGALGTEEKIILDRVWIHGTAQDETKNGIQLNGISWFALIDSYATDFHCISDIGACSDAKVVGGGTGTTQDSVWRITNNFLEASGENVIFGGAAATTTPTDIQIEHNHFFKPLIWMAGQPGFVGGVNTNTTQCISTPGQCPFIVKNILELKNAQRVLVEGNILEYSWGGFSQNGYGILLSPKNQQGSCFICQVTDVTIRYNTISHTGAGIQFSAFEDAPGQYGMAEARYSIHDIIVDDISISKYNGSGGLFQIVNSWPNTSLQHLSIDHITGFPDIGGKIATVSNLNTNPVMQGFVLTNSIIGQALYPFWSASGNSTDCSIADKPLKILNTCWPQGYTANFNAFIGVNLTNYPNSGTGNVWPIGNKFPLSTTSVGFNNYSGGDYSLSATSPYKNAGSDGKDLGADTVGIRQATIGVR